MINTRRDTVRTHRCPVGLVLILFSQNMCLECFFSQLRFGPNFTFNIWEYLFPFLFILAFFFSTFYVDSVFFQYFGATFFGLVSIAVVDVVIFFLFYALLIFIALTSGET